MMTGQTSTQHDVVGDRHQRPLGARLRVVEEADSYTKSVAGATVEAIRVGRGIGPNRVLGITGEQLTVTRSTIGFPMRTYSSVGANQIIAAHIHRTSPGSRWCGIPLRNGIVVVYGPGAEHAASNQPGLSFTFAATSLEELVALGESIDVPFEPPARGEVRVFGPCAGTRDLGASLASYTLAAANDGPIDRCSHDVRRRFASLLASTDCEQPMNNLRGIDSRDVVRACIDFAVALDRIPTIAELCLAAHVSERRLRDAFNDEFGEPPSRFFRSWALDRAHRRLREADPAQCTVTTVATGIGFDHLGRFAGHYHQVYGESPVVTLRATTGRMR